MMERMSLEQAERGVIIQDEDNKLYLIVHRDDYCKSLRCIDQRFGEISIGTDWIGKYYFYDKIDMVSFIEILMLPAQYSMEPKIINECKGSVDQHYIRRDKWRWKRLWLQAIRNS